MKHLCPLCSREMEIDDQRLTEMASEALKDVPVNRRHIAQAAIESCMVLLPQVAHDECIKNHEHAHQTAQQKAIQHKLSRRWAAACPPNFQRTDYHRITFAQKAEALNAAATGRSVILNGESGTGKSRLLWLMARPPFFQMKKVWIYTHVQLASTIAAEAMKGSQWLDLMVKKLKEAHVLLIDDFGKAKMVGQDGQSLKNEELLFEIIDHRLNFDLQTIITTNDTPETLVARMSADKGQPLVRRLHDLCLSFTASPS